MNTASPQPQDTDPNPPEPDLEAIARELATIALKQSARFRLVSREHHDGATTTSYQVELDLPPTILHFPR
jgi:hypothetical protein